MDTDLHTIPADQNERMLYRYTSVDDHGVPLLHLNILARGLGGQTSAKELAAEFGCTEDTVRKVFGHGPYRRWLREKLDALYNKRFTGMLELQESFLDVSRGLQGLLKSEDEKVRLEAIKVYIKALGVGVPEPPQTRRSIVDNGELEDMRSAYQESPDA